MVEDVAAARKAVSVATMGSSFGTGGMQTKLIAAELATAAGVATVILNGERPENMIKVVAKGIPTTTTSSSSGEGGVAVKMDSLASSVSSLTSEEKELIGYPPLDGPAHTLFLPKRNPLSSRKWSILHALHPAGALIIDEGAFNRIARHDSGGRLLPAGVVGVEGNWERMQAIRLVVRRRIPTSHPHTTGLGQGASFSDSNPIARNLGQYLLRSDSEAALSGTRTPPVIDSLRKDVAVAPPSPDVDSGSQPPGAETVATGGNGGDEGEDWEWQLIEVGRALANYTSIESERIKGLKSSQITSVLGYADSDYVTDQVALHTLSLPPASSS